MSDKSLSFQEIIFRLQTFWSSQGCVILQPYDLMMGAGTFHWATTLKSLGPKPWRAAYVQPSRRPTDGRYGDNPNRLQHFYQFQVLCKPSPPDSQRLFLDSLAAIGISHADHDIRFIEDDWESPTLGAAGLGWEVWCDGMEIAQFTYFQQMGGIECRPVSTELTYGLERIAMFIQNKDNILDIRYDEAGALTYGDIFKRREREGSEYNFKRADTDELWRLLAKHQSDCKQMLSGDDPLVTVAYDFCVSASHVFNVLDARKEVSHQKRAELILSIRDLASACCQAWLRTGG